MVGRCALRVVVTSKDRAAVRLSLLSPLSCFLAPLTEAFLSLSAAPLILLMALAKDTSSNRLRSVLDTRIYQTADCGNGKEHRPMKFASFFPRFPFFFY